MWAYQIFVVEIDIDSKSYYIIAIPTGIKVSFMILCIFIYFWGFNRNYFIKCVYWYYNTWYIFCYSSLSLCFKNKGCFFNYNRFNSLISYFYRSNNKQFIFKNSIYFIFFGVNLTFFLIHFSGLVVMPRRYLTYSYFL